MNLDNLHILVIDEQPSTRVLCDLLREQNHTVELMPDLQTLNAHLVDFPEYDVILVEVDLPDEPGGEPIPRGVELYNRLQTYYPHSQIRLFISSEQALFQKETDAILPWIDKARAPQHVAVDVSSVALNALQHKLAQAQKVSNQISHIAQMLLDGVGLEDIRKIIIEAIAGMGFDRVRLAQFEEETGAYQIVSSTGHGNPDGLMTMAWLTETDLFDVSNPEPVLIHHVDAVAEQFFNAKWVGEKTHQRVELPLIVDHIFIGYISADTNINGRLIGRSELQPLMRIANQAAIALNKLSLEESESIQNRLHQTMVDISSQISQLIEPDEIYPAISKGIVDLFPAIDHSGLVIFDPNQVEGTVASEYPDKGMAGTKIPLKGVEFEESLLAGASFIEAFDVTTDARMGEVGEILSDLGVKSVLIVPIYYEGRLLGSFSLDAQEKQHQFSEDEIQLAQIFATSVGAALSNAERVRKLNLLTEAAATLGRAIRLENPFEEIVSLAARLLQGRSGGIAAVDRDRQGVQLLFDSGRVAKRDPFVPYGYGIAGHLIATKEPFVITPDYSQEPYQADVFDGDSPFGSVVAVPLGQQDEPTGVLYVDDIVGRKFSTDDAENLRVFASYASNILSTLNLLDSRTHLINVLESLHLIGDAIESAANIDRIVHLALFGITAPYALNCDQATLFLLDDSDEPTRLIHHSAIGEIEAKDHAAATKALQDQEITSPGIHLSLYDASGLPESTLHTQTQGLAIDLIDPAGASLKDWLISTAHTGEFDRLVQPRPQLESLPPALAGLLSVEAPKALVSLVSQNKPIGLLVIHNPHSLRAIDKGIIKALRTFGTSAAVAIAKTRLIKTVTEDADRVRKLYDLGNRGFTEKGNRTIYMEEILEETMRISGADGASFVRIDPETRSVGRIIAVGLYKTQQMLLRDIRPNGHSLEVMDTGTPFQVENTAQANQDLNHTVYDLNIKAIICLPARADIGIGVIWLAYYAPQKFHDKVISAWQLFANHAALTYRLLSDKDRLSAERKFTQEITQMVAFSKSNEDVHERITRGIRSMLEAESVRLYIYDHERCHIESAWESGQPGEFKAVDTDISHETAIRTLMQLDESVHFDEDLERNEMFESFKHLIPSPIEGSSFIAPLVWEEEKRGLITVLYPTQGDFSPSRRKSIIRLQQFCAATLANDAKITAYNQQLARSNTLNTISLRKNEFETLDELFPFVTKTLFDFFEELGNPIAQCNIRLRKGSRLEVQAIEPADADQLPFLIPEDGRNQDANPRELGVSLAAFWTGIPQYKSDLSENPTLSIGSEIAIPLNFGKHVLGVINIEHHAVDAFKDDDIELITSIAQQVTSVIIRKRQEEQRNAFQAISTMIASAVTKPNVNPDLLEQIVDMMHPLKGTNIAMATLHEVNQDQLMFGQVYPPANWLNKWESLDIGKRWLNGEQSDGRIGITGRCARTLKAQLVSDVQSDSDYIQLNPATRSELAVPVKMDGHLIAVLAVQSPQYDAFTDADLRLLDTFAQLVVIVRQNARQFDELSDTRKRVEGRTALALVNMINASYQHANKTHALTAQLRLILLKQTLENLPQTLEIQNHIQEIEDAISRILNQRIMSNVTDHASTTQQRLSLLLAEYFDTSPKPYAIKGVEIDFKHDQDDDLQVRGHREWFIELFDLICRNSRSALAGHESPKLTIRSSIDRQKMQAKITFADNGPGFPEKILPVLLVEPIQKKAGEPGSGIGLLMAQLIVQTYGGAIKADNASDGGAVISVCMPLEAAEFTLITEVSTV